MKKLIYLFLALIIVACSSDDSSDDSGGNDSTAPIITLNGEAIATVNLNSTYTDAGATATDEVDGDLTSSIVTTGVVNTSIEGNYIITYTVSDTSGNTATATRQVIVEGDTTAPVITILGEADVSINQYTPYIDAGATATDNVDGDLTSSIIKSGTVNINSIGSYIITYTVSDTSGNTATATRQVIVEYDAWTPAGIPTTGWYDASDFTTISLNTGKVSEWRDKSGNGYTATQATAAEQPAYTTGLVNGLNSVEFANDDGSDNMGYAFLLTEALGLQLVGTKYAVIASQARYNGNSQNHFVGGVSGAGSNNNLHIGYDNTQICRFGQFSNDVDITIPGYNNTEDAIITALNRTTGGKLIRYNGGFYENSNSNTTNLASNTGFSIGRFGSYRNFSGRVNEIVILDYNVTDEIYQKIEGYLAWKWGTEGSLPTSHPYKTSPPTN